MKYKIYDQSFGHQPNMSWHWKSKHGIEWVRNEEYAPICFFTDFEMHRVNGCESEKKIAILVEPPAILNSHYDFIKANHDKFNYVLTYNRELMQINPDKFLYYPMAAPWIPVEDRGVHQKSRTCSIVASTKKEAPGHALRHQIIERFAGAKDPAAEQRYKRQLALAERVNRRIDRRNSNRPAPVKPPGGIDVYGCGFGPFKHPKTPYLKDYMFSFAIINSKLDDYYTEIVTDCFALGTIPIYWGTPNISKYFNPDGIIQFNSIDEVPDIMSSLTPELYNSKLAAVRENYDLANQYLVAEDYMYEKYPFLWN